MFFEEKNTFFTENARFSRLIDYYARRLKDPCAKADLWGFLWILLATAKRGLNDRYIAVCLRNEWLRMSREQTRAPICCDDFSRFGFSFAEKPIEMLCDIANAFKELTEKESAVLRLHYVGGYSIDEVAKLNKITRQAVNKTKLCGIEKMRRKILGLDN